MPGEAGRGLTVLPFHGRGKSPTVLAQDLQLYSKHRLSNRDEPLPTMWETFPQIKFCPLHHDPPGLAISSIQTLF